MLLFLISAIAELTAVSDVNCRCLVLNALSDPTAYGRMTDINDIGPKKKYPAKQIENVKKTLDFLMSELLAFRLHEETFQKTILQLLEEVKCLRVRNAGKDGPLVFVETQVAELKQCSRINDVIILE
ncbi:hypothetical protein ATANTOWER_022912 [Ataeniobius toweri]|uniref:Uncharacterized protein n=1 Tax=Ataeniobius toweri TaxID=208326 RepID=A0ABU7BRG5_9TELE|nr:hypothetical protein [Ataeniobius toweri]